MKKETLRFNMENGNWKLGSVLEAFIYQVQQQGYDGVEAELKRIREKTFERMRNHTPVNITWEQIYNVCAMRKTY